MAAQLESAEELRTTWRQAGAEVRRARQAYQDARRGAERARAAAREAWTHLETARDALAGYRPPMLDREDLQAAWSQLAVWAAQTAQTRQEQRPALEAAVTTATDDVAQVRDRLRALFGGHDLAAPEPLDAAGLSTAVAVAVTQADGEHQRLAEQLAQLVQHRADRHSY
ncbi:MAG: hypothetical protein GEU88_21210, partial [Solirubrobacterales bacterium]|nr:hypothetical protein [Solirubrobacterales bacterium]